MAESVDLDDIDRAILEILQDDGRIPWSRMADLVGLSAPATRDRVRRLEQNGALRGIRARIDPRTVGAGTLAFVSVALNDALEHQRVVELAATRPEILECHVVAGAYDVLLKIRTSSPEALARLLRDHVRRLPGVTATNSTVVLESVKETDALPIG